jgi:hypothetical protein
MSVSSGWQEALAKNMQTKMKLKQQPGDCHLSKKMEKKRKTDHPKGPA